MSRHKEVCKVSVSVQLNRTEAKHWYKKQLWEDEFNLTVCIIVFIC